ncbi:heavy metal-associated domain-containing protein [Georgenia sp. 10Sc9-8]|uniref:Heavy metal-associated domain-containing protein n=1 Tax=Georgenia halotolerans TaxID=3028317 RepID=A0ABT5U0X5_9MICO|nr:heavy metal-associated domain-containing protein [Georgenia halotolerans]
MSHTPRTFVGTVTVEVTGMTCRHCAEAVGHAVAEVPGVADVRVDLPAGEVHVTAHRAADRADVVAAVEAAGHSPQP